MRIRLALALSLAAALLLCVPSVAWSSTIQLAQPATDTDEEGGELEGGEAGTSEGGGESDEGGTTDEAEGGEGQSDADAESGAGQDEQEDASTATEEGPPWTYQMARITLALLVLLGLMLALMYRKLVINRARGV